MIWRVEKVFENDAGEVEIKLVQLSEVNGEPLQAANFIRVPKEIKQALVDIFEHPFGSL